MIPIFRILFLLLLIQFSLWGDYNPVAAYICWRHDPTTTATIQWLTKEGEETHDLFYRKEGEKSWKIALAKQIPLPGKLPFVLQRVEVFNLEPGANYLFKPGHWNADTRKFRTLSNNPNETLRFIVGGDMYHDALDYLMKTHRQAAKQHPHFAIAGGDLAYASTKHVNRSKPRNKRWITFLKAWSNAMVTPEGYTIPIVPAIGNHDVNGRYGQLPKEAAYFYTLFPLPRGKSFYSLDFGKRLSLFILDSGHTNQVYGKQPQWLEQALKERTESSHKFAAYHVPAYPSYRKYKGTVSMQIRQHWVPLFERYGLTAAFEHHDHTYKRTHPLLNGEIDETGAGVVYLGDGAYGMRKVRTPKSPDDVWYLACTARERHFICVTIEGKSRKFQAISDQGKIFDELEQNPKF